MKLTSIQLMNILNNLKTKKNRNMKTHYIYIIIALLLITSCKQNKNQTQEKVSFEIYETLTQKEVPTNLIEEFRQMNIQLNTDTHSPIIAFVPVDSTLHLIKITNDNLKFLQTAQPVDKDKKYLAIVAVKKQAELNISDIKRAKPNQNNVELYFNLKGANKWANLTNDNIGKMLAFTIDKKVYALPLVNAEIKNGVAILNGLENENEATKISNSLNLTTKPS
jgi:preprotein translocase subunit SecD